MCLSIPGRVVEIKKNEKVVVDYGGEKREVNNINRDINLGDYVLVSQKIVIKKIDKKVALETLNYIKKNLKKND